MHQRKGDEKGDITGQTAGDVPHPEDEFDFPDWDNPEDRDDDAPEGYYDDLEDEAYEDDDEDDGYVPEPGDPDYDLSEAAGYAGYEAPQNPTPVPQWLLTLFALMLILALIFPIYLSVR